MVSRVPNGIILRLISATWLVVAGLLVVRVLRGEKPADLPVQAADQT